MVSHTAADRSWLYQPAAVAVVGASRNPAKIGHRVVAALVGGGYKGAIYPVNPAGGTVAGIRALRDVDDLPEGLDLAVVAVPAAQVLDATRALARRRVRGAVVVASGFGEMPGGVELQDELLAVAEAAGMRLVGPNSEGIIDFRNDFNCSFGSGFQKQDHPHQVAIVSQSGGFTGQLYRLLDERNLGCDRIVSGGNEGDLVTADFLEDLQDSRDISCVLVYQEATRQGPRLLQVVERLSSACPVVVFKAGRTSVGSSAALSHTGAMASDFDVARGVLTQHGAVMAMSIDELVDRSVGAVLARGSRRRPRGVAVLSQSGGAAVEIADLLTEAGADLPALAGPTQAELRDLVPGYGAVRNPVDMTATVLEDPEITGRAFAAVARDPSVGVVVLALTDAGSPALWGHLQEAVQGAAVPLLIAWLGSKAEENAGRRHLRQSGWPHVLSSRGLVDAVDTLFSAATRLDAADPPS